MCFLYQMINNQHTHLTVIIYNKKKILDEFLDTVSHYEISTIFHKAFNTWISLSLCKFFTPVLTDSVFLFFFTEVCVTASLLSQVF